MNIRIRFSLICLLFLAFLLNAALANSSLPPINIAQLKSGDETLLVGRIPDFKPFYINNNPSAPGMDAEILKEVVRRIGIKKVKFVDFYDFEELNEALKNGKINIIVNDYWAIPAHKQFLWTIPYYRRDGIAFVYSKERNNFSQVADLKNHKIGAFRESTDVVNWVKSHPELKHNLITYHSRIDMLQALEKGEIDAAFIYYTLYLSIFSEFHKEHPFGLVKAMTVNAVFAVRPQDINLQQELNHALKTMWSDGSLYQIKKKYLEKIDIKPLTTYE